jgi:hypothetical protein
MLNVVMLIVIGPFAPFLSMKIFLPLRCQNLGSVGNGTTTFSMTTHNITTLSIEKLSIMGLFAPLSITTFSTMTLSI